jgi:hypothetical protein
MMRRSFFKNEFSNDARRNEVARTKVPEPGEEEKKSKKKIRRRQCVKIIVQHTRARSISSSSTTPMVAPSYNKKKSTLVKITKGNALSKKKKIALKKKHDKNKTMQSGKARTGKAKRKALRNSRRAEQNKIDDAIRKSKEAGDAGEKDVEMKDFD